LDDLKFVQGHGEAFRRQHISKVFTGSNVELAYVCMGKKYVNMESLKYFLDMGLVLGDIVGVDENVIQMDDDFDIDYICEDVVHKMLKSHWCINKPFGHYHPLKRTILGLKHSLAFVSSSNSNKVAHVLEVDFGIDSCLSGCI